MPLPTENTTARVGAAPPEQVDVAIIGCGLGGLSAGAFLARQGLSVACFDPHYVAGGCTTQFARGRKGSRYLFDVGLHYIGECHPEGRMTAMLRALGVDQTFEALDPDGVDVLVFPELRFSVPASAELYRQRLVELFPKEAKGIDRYLALVKQVDQIGRKMDRTEGKMSPAALWHILTKAHLLPFNQSKTIGQFLDGCIKEPLLKAILLGQNGDYALPPSEVSALLHAGLAAHYLHGGWYPRGGGQTLADKTAAVIEDNGGVIALRCAIEKVLVENGRAVGVVTEPRRGTRHTVRAKAVISNADLKKTLLELVGPEHLPGKLLKRTSDYTMPRALFMTCLGVKGDLAELGMKNHNLWAFDGHDFDAMYKAMDNAIRPEVFAAYVTSASLKDPTTTDHAPAGHQTIEVMSMVPGRAERWGVRPEEVATRRYNSNPTYQAHKQRIEDDLLERLERLLPGINARITYRESATPVTHSRYTRATDGTSYGIASTPNQVLDKRPGSRGPLPGLYLCGSSTRPGHGIVAAMHSGYVAACKVCRDLGHPTPEVF